MSLEKVDLKIVKEGFIVVNSYATSHSFVDKDAKGNPFGRDFHAPKFQIMKVHRSHPVRIKFIDFNYIKIFPVSKVYNDKMNYDVCTFMMIPYDVQDLGKHWKKFPVERGFSSIGGEERESSLVYLAHGLEIGSGNFGVSEVMHSQVLPHLNSWMFSPNKITSYENTFKRKVEGQIYVPDTRRSELNKEFASLLEKRYKTYLGSDKF